MNTTATTLPEAGLVSNVPTIPAGTATHSETTRDAGRFLAQSGRRDVCTTARDDVLRTFAWLHAAYVECVEPVRQLVDDLSLAVCNDGASDSDTDVDCALTAMIDLLTPAATAGRGPWPRAVAPLPCFWHEPAVPDRAPLGRPEAMFATRLAERMREKEVTPEWLGHQSGVGELAVARLLDGQGRPRLRTVVRIAHALGVTPDDLWPDVRPPATTPA